MLFFQPMFLHFFHLYDQIVCLCFAGADSVRVGKDRADNMTDYPKEIFIR